MARRPRRLLLTAAKGVAAVVFIGCGKSGGAPNYSPSQDTLDGDSTFEGGWSDTDAETAENTALDTAGNSAVDAAIDAAVDAANDATEVADQDIEQTDVVLLSKDASDTTG